VAAAWAIHLHQQGLANLRACPTVEAGLPRASAVQAFGAPTHSSMNPAGTRLALFFRSPWFASKPIRAIVNVRDDVVMEVDCGDGRISTYEKY
jgi:hypothetical protein